MQRSKAARVVIVGGSVGGLSAAHELRAIGAEAAVYERSAGRMEARGAGVVMQPEVEALLVRLGLSAREVSVELRERQQLHLHGRATRYEAPQLMTSWDTLYRVLREPVAGLCYRLDSALRRVRVEGSEVTAEFADGYTTRGHFLVGADGIGSATRQLLDPATRPSYAGYVAWRGLEPESAVPGDLLEVLKGRFSFFGSDGLQMLCYLVPGPDGELAEGSRRVNWVWYMNVPEPDLARLLASRSGRPYTTFLPPGEILPEIASELGATADASLPAPFAQLVRLSNVFMQPVFDLAPHRMVADHAALIGDAAGTVRPHTASGTSKAFADAAGLAAALRGWTPDQELPAGRLADWEQERLLHLVALSRAGIDLASRSSLGTTGSRRFFISS
ncbi:monooxygenase [Streptomyces sp. SID8382]|uniref:FAD binding domain-containing protein n=1 Tax=Streptomyces malaysiensis TaxID=92644 RepID=UPI000C2CB670|nr:MULTISPECIES: FAD-dependent monooxygenase [unclassified Streptomyces]AUA07975.1 6-hydroxynicotinate 3-monooxygenase precursor [Streptomyces sp. M56]MYX62779.1 monooxygenase [Streptomyces sp. SID8382]